MSNKDVSDELWEEIRKNCESFAYVPSFRSDLFYLLACILAFYTERDNGPPVTREGMSTKLDQTVGEIIERARGRVTERLKVPLC